MLKADRIACLVIFVAAAGIVVESLSYDFFHRGIPGPGFLPVFLGGALVLLSIMQFIATFAKKEGEPEENPFTCEKFKPFIVFLGSCVIVVLVTPFTGLLIPLGLMVGFTAWYFGTKNKVTLILLTILTPVITYGLFEAFLGVPMPKGFLGI